MCADNESPHPPTRRTTSGTQAVTKLIQEAQREGRGIAGHNPHLEPSHTAPLKAGSITPTRRRPRIR